MACVKVFVVGKIIYFLGQRGGMWSSINKPILRSGMASDLKKGNLRIDLHKL